jgi:hypothetical protein
MKRLLSCGLAMALFACAMAFSQTGLSRKSIQAVSVNVTSEAAESTARSYAATK